METRSSADGTVLLQAARALEPLVRSVSSQFDQQRRLPETLVDAIGSANLFGMWLPQALGGSELPPLEFLEIIEELSRQDGSVGWCTVIAAGYGRLSGAMPLDAARDVFGSGRGILVGTLNPTGKAVAVPGGYRVTGRWGYGSFINYSHWVLGNCVTERAGGTGGDGPEFRICIFPRNETELFDNWQVGGLRATGSNDFQVTDLFVPEDRCIRLVTFSPPPVQPGPLYAVPMTSTFVSCIAIVMLGIARAAIEALVELSAAKTLAGSSTLLRDKPSAQADLAFAEALVRSGRAFLWDELGGCWDDALAGRPVMMQRRAMVRLAACQAGENAIQAADLMYRCAGGASLFESNRLERCFRDIHAAGQHIAVAPQNNREPIGRVLFGLDPGMVRF